MKTNHRISRGTILRGAYIAVSALLLQTSSIALASGLESKSTVNRFSENSEVPVVLKRIPRSSQNVLPGSSLKELMEPLRDAANFGDASAARMLGKGLRICRSAFRSESEMEGAISILEDRGLRNYGDGREPTLVSQDSIDDVSAIMRKQFEFCRGISSPILKAQNYGRQWLSSGVTTLRWSNYSLDTSARIMNPSKCGTKHWHEATFRPLKN